MASYFQSFISTSSMPKRLLQYALAHLEIVDTDTLGLDNLDIKWGKKNILEFKDVALQLKKIESILQLPPSLELAKARILLLRISIPVNITSSPIVVEVEGVDCQILVKERNEPDRKRKRKQKEKPHRKESNIADDEDQEQILPTAADLAQSFYTTEPEDEKAELEAALYHDAGSSSILSEDGEIPMGTGAALSVPEWMTGFLQGIVNRLEVRIRDVSINLEVDIPHETSRSSPIPTSDPVTVQLRIDTIDIEGVTNDLEVISASEGGPQNPILKRGKRLVCLNQIRAALVTEANLFSSLARSSALSSPAATHSRLFESRRSSKSQTSSRSKSRYDEASSLEFSSTSLSSKHSSTSFHSTASGYRSLQQSAIASDSGRFDDASDDGRSHGRRDSIGADSEDGDSIFQNSVYLDQITQSQFEDDDSEEVSPNVSHREKSRQQRRLADSPSSTPRATSHVRSTPQDNEQFTASNAAPRIPSMMQSTILAARPHPRFSDGRVSQSQPTLPSDLITNTTFARTISPSLEASSNKSGNESDASTPIGEDLTESQYFSHEEAESMYLSAISQRSPPVKMPGDWSRSSSESSDRRSALLTAHPPSEAPSADLTNAGSDQNISPKQSPLRNNSIEDLLPTASGTLPREVLPPVVSQIHTIPESTSNASERSEALSDEYTRISKNIFSIDRIAVYIPDSKKAANVEPLVANAMLRSTFDGSGSESVSVNLPGSFSGYMPARERVPQKPKSPTANDKPSEENLASIEVEIGDVLGHFDISVGRLAWRLVQRLQEALAPATEGFENPITDKSQARPDMSLTARLISLQFLDRLEGVLVPTSNSTIKPWIPALDSDILLRTALKGLSIKTSTIKSTSQTDIKVHKFNFGYAYENILSFDANFMMGASTRDLRAEDGIDASMAILQGVEGTRIDINTLPMHISIDLQRLDETFSWFGGLSSVLNLGSSFASNATVTTAIASKPKSRSVRFETERSPEPPLLVSKTKTDIRIGGFVLDLVGTECSIGVETSAIKIISRGPVLGLAIHKINLSGPHLKSSNNDPAISVEVIGTRMEFLQSPRDTDLDTLLSLITPSKAQYDQDDDILLDTLLRQRKKGSVLRLNIEDFQCRIGRLGELSYLPELGEELSRLSTVAKYLPEDDRPGLLSLVKVQRFGARVDIGKNIGSLKLAVQDIEVAQITFPALIALSVNALTLHRNSSEELIGPGTEPELREPGARAPAIMARMIGDEMDPVIKIKLWNLKAEYRVPTLIALLDLAENATSHDISASLTASVATLTGLPRHSAERVADVPLTGPVNTRASNPMTIDIVMRDCILGLNPLGLPSKILVVLTEAHFSAIMPKNKDVSASCTVGKAALLVIDDVVNIKSGQPSTRLRRQSFDGGSSQVGDLCANGFVSVSYISSAKVALEVVTDEDGEKSIDVELRDDLFVLETCADSTQTIVAAMNSLAPPTPPSKEMKYRTKVIPVADLLASLSGDAFGTAEGEYNFDDDFDISALEDPTGDEEIDDFDFDSQYYQTDSHNQDDGVLRTEGDSLTSSRITIRDTSDGVLLESFSDTNEESGEAEELDFQENHFGSGSILEGTAHRWNSTKNTYEKSNPSKVRKSPIKVCVRDVHIIWNLFDGYDWQSTRDRISQAVEEVEHKAIERRARRDRRPAFEQEIEDDETVIGDFLFNSIYIGIPKNRDPRELAAAINQELNDNATETESIATTYLSSSPSRQGGPRRSGPKRLRLKRSKHHKITFELKGVCLDFVAFPEGSGETQSSIDVRIRDLEVFDHVPTSTWRKFATYMQEAGERETGTSMVHIEILNTKPVPELPASEIVLKATILPLRLHVDQDALDFITRFFEFKDDSIPVKGSPGEQPFLQRVEVNSIQVKLDFKPKRVDYAGLRSGHTTEFMNFLILDEADMVLRHTIIYGVSGFEKLGKTLNDIWMPEIKRNQLPGILAGLAPVRSIVNVGGGFKHLVVIPMREYKKDGRLVRGISKGAAAFAKTTGTELVKLGAKVAIGVQTVLQGAEGLLSPASESTMPGLEASESDEESKQISLYANQPVGVMQGLRGGYAGLQRDLIVARDAIIAVPGEVMEGGNAAGVLKAVRKHAPTVILRPAIGVAKAGGQVLMGATNTLDPANLQKADAKYKRH